jgi:hypothetical protein
MREFNFAAYSVSKRVDAAKIVATAPKVLATTLESKPSG